jgi:hypothetical protein
MAKFKVLLERIETITHQGEVMVEASTADEARRIILSDLFVDQGSYDDHLEPVESALGDMTVATEASRNDPEEIPWPVAGRA